MYLKITAFLIIGLSFILCKVQGCKVYCVVCPSDKAISKYYCCMEDWENEPRVRDCGYEASTTESSTATPPTGSSPTASSGTTATPTTPTTPTIDCVPSKCPQTETLSEEECTANKRILPSPVSCSSAADCPTPFKNCCPDRCYNYKICKTDHGESSTLPTFPSA